MSFDKGLASQLSWINCHVVIILYSRHSYRHKCIYLLSSSEIGFYTHQNIDFVINKWLGKLEEPLRTSKLDSGKSWGLSRYDSMYHWLMSWCTKQQCIGFNMCRASQFNVPHKCLKVLAILCTCVTQRYSSTWLKPHCASLTSAAIYVQRSHHRVDYPYWP